MRVHLLDWAQFIVWFAQKMLLLRPSVQSVQRMNGNSLA